MNMNWMDMCDVLVISNSDSEYRKLRSVKSQQFTWKYQQLCNISDLSQL